jgi:hypothetical protein
MIPLITSGPPPLKKNGISSPPWMITADLSFMPPYARKKPAGLIFRLSKQFFSAMGYPTPTM